MEVEEIITPHSDEEALRLEQRFAKAVEVLQSLGPEEHTMVPTNDEKLAFYGLYKQATVGPVSTSRPSLWDVVARSKWDAWNKVKHLSSSEAKESYVDAVIKFLKRFPDRPLAAEVVEYFELSRAGMLSVESDSDDGAGYSDRGDLSDVEPHTPIHPDDEFEAPIDTPPHYEERPASDSSSSSLSSRILDALIERVRTLEVEVATLRTDVGDQRRLVKRAIHGGSRRARLMRIVKNYVPSAIAQFVFMLLALLFCGYRPTADSKFMAFIIWMVMKRQELMG